MEEEAQQLVPVARGLDAEALDEQVLLLSALGIPYALVPAEGDVVLAVPAALAERVRDELAGQAREVVTPSPRPVLRGGARAGIPAALFLLASHAVLQRLPAAAHARVLAVGELDAARVHAGELGRVVTALTLHADLAHVVGNAVATAIFVTAVGDWIGPGLALLCTVLAGIAGNLVAALVDPGHHAIGFSTATFGALGLTAVLGFVARFGDRLERRRAWLALGAGVALLAMLGAGERSDVLAHILGLVAGAGLGLVVGGRPQGARTSTRPGVGAVGQVASALLAVAVVALGWAVQLGKLSR